MIDGLKFISFAILLVVAKSANAFIIEVAADSATSIYVTKDVDVICYSDTVLNKKIIFKGVGSMQLDSKLMKSSGYAYLLARKEGFEIFKIKLPKNKKEYIINIEKHMIKLPSKNDSTCFIDLFQTDVKVYFDSKTVKDELNYYHDKTVDEKNNISSYYRSVIDVISSRLLNKGGYLEKDVSFKSAEKTLRIEVDMEVYFSVVRSYYGESSSKINHYIVYTVIGPNGKLYYEKRMSYEQIFHKKDKWNIDVLFSKVDAGVLELLNSDTIRKSKSIIQGRQIVTEKEWKDLCVIQSDRENCSMADLKQCVVSLVSKKGHGSGFFVSSDGYIVTNNHVVSGEDSVTVLMYSGDSAMAEILRVSPEYDLALLKIRSDTIENYLKLPDSFTAKVKDDIMVVGTPIDLRLGHSVSNGFIASTREFKDSFFIQFQGTVNPGNSGGPLLNSKGNLIGVVSQKLVGFGVNQVGFALPAVLIKRVLKIDYE